MKGEGKGKEDPKRPTKLNVARQVLRDAFALISLARHRNDISNIYVNAQWCSMNWPLLTFVSDFDTPKK